MFLSLCLVSPYSAESQDNDRSLKVRQLIEKIERESLTAESALLRTAVISESELNAYIIDRISAEKEDVLRALEFKLLAKNEIEGRALVDLSGRQIPAGLHPRMNFFFSARIRSMDRKIKLEIQSLYLEQQKISTALLDLIIFVVSKSDNGELLGIQDWHDLPYGIKILETEVGKLVVRY